jgi:voltage-gated potassium channel
MDQARPQSQDFSAWQVLMLFLSAYVLVALLIESVFKLDADAAELLQKVDFYVCMAFLIDFSVRFYQAPSKRAYMKWGWIDLLSSIPILDSFRMGRLVRIIRLIRILRALRSTRTLLGFFLRGRSNSFAAVAAISFMLVVFSSIAVLQFEDGADANIKSPQDAFWWAYTTITTVGYGDRFPVSPEGRILACILMTAGVGLFGTFTGFIASLFVEPEIKREDSEIQLLTKEIQALRQEVRALQQNQGPTISE